MATDSRQQIIKNIKQRKYLNRDFDSLKSDLLEYARTYFPNNNKDWTESSLAGLLLELVAFVGDVDSFYLDHLFHELNIDTATENKNIEAHLKNSGVKIYGASPAVVYQTCLVEIPATLRTDGLGYRPLQSAIPIIEEDSVISSNNGIQFRVTEDINYNDTDPDGNYIASVSIGQTDVNNNPKTYVFSRKVFCISGFITTESFSVGSFEQFKTYTLSKENVTDILSVTDNLGNTYYEVEYLTQDTVFKKLSNRNNDKMLVKDLLTIQPAPYRFISNTNLSTRLATLTFGGGSAQSLNDDIIPDPSEFSLPLYGKKTFSRFTINPNNMLQTTTLGVIAPNSIITVTYRHGGGLSHNVSPGAIKGFSTLLMTFPNEPTPQVAQFVRTSADSINETRSSGGEDAPTVDELKLRAPAVKASQGRIVSKEDLLARIYTMPSNFGRVFRASQRPNPNNPLSTIIYTISRDSASRLIPSPDSLKDNISTYLNQFRLSNESYDILDASVVNLGISFTVVVHPEQNKNTVKQNILSALSNYFSIKNFEIDQPIVINDIENIIYNNIGVLSIVDIKFKNITGTILNDQQDRTNKREYSIVYFDVNANTDKKIIFPPPGGIFEIRHKDFDLEGTVL